MSKKDDPVVTMSVLKTVIDDALTKQTEEFSAIMQDMMQLMASEFDKTNKRIDGVDGRLDGIDGRLDGIEEKLENLDDRMDRVERKQDATIATNDRHDVRISKLEKQRA